MSAVCDGGVSGLIDILTMVVANFGFEYWSCRGALTNSDKSMGESWSYSPSAAGMVAFEH